MSLKEWFANRRKAQPAKALDANGMNRLPDEALTALWAQCFGCNAQLPQKEMDAAAGVCPKCGYHHRIGARERIALLCDQFAELDGDLAPADPLTFHDTQPYVKRQKEARKKALLNDALVSGVGVIQTEKGPELLALAVMDFTYMGGSMGSVVGEKITRMTELALAKQLPLLVVTSSGGARMQEGMFSLMQMVKTSAALARLHEAGLLYITLLTEPTFGGVTASYGTLGDLILAEEGARVGFAGRRVIEQTIRQKLPADFQTAGYLMKYGQVDQVLHRHAIKATLAQLIALHRKSSGLNPLLSSKDLPDLAKNVAKTVAKNQSKVVKQPVGV